MFKLIYKPFAFVKTTVNMVKLKNISVSLTSYFKEKIKKWEQRRNTDVEIMKHEFYTLSLRSL